MSLDPELAGFYRDQFVALLPPGRIWPQRQDSAYQQLLLALADSLAVAHAAILHAYWFEMFPGTTFELIGEWETMLGLPDPCAPPAQTIQERRARIIERLTVQPRATLEYLKALAVALGYIGVEMTETGPYEITVLVPHPRVTYFQTGSSVCGDLLGKIDRADDLECLLREQKPAHIEIVFNYSGV